MSKYKILVKTLTGNILTFSVRKYEITEGDFVTFIDEKNNIPKKFHSSNCEIIEVEE